VEKKIWESFIRKREFSRSPACARVCTWRTLYNFIVVSKERRVGAEESVKERNVRPELGGTVAL